MRVYLAGGLKSDWQDHVMSAVPDVSYFDPRTLNTLTRPAGAAQSYGAIAFHERAWLEQCHIVFAYLERDNPSGVGLAAELGYAVALHKQVILVDEWNNSYSRWLQSFVGGIGVRLDIGVGVEVLRAWTR